MGKKFVHSTCGQPMVFTFNAPIPADSKDTAVKVIKEIRIGGGAWVIGANKRTPKVVITEVTDEELEMLERNESFINMKKRGFLTVREEDHGVYDSRGVPEDMEKKDRTSQIQDEEHAHGGDERVDGTSDTRASYGEGDQFVGEQPDASANTAYGNISLA